MSNTLLALEAIYHSKRSSPIPRWPERRDLKLGGGDPFSAKAARIFQPQQGALGF